MRLAAAVLSSYSRKLSVCNAVKSLAVVELGLAQHGFKMAPKRALRCIGGQKISTSLLRKHLPEMLPDLVLPKMLRSATLSPAIALAETQDAAVYAKGDANAR